MTEKDQHCQAPKKERHADSGMTVSPNIIIRPEPPQALGHAKTSENFGTTSDRRIQDHSFSLIKRFRFLSLARAEGRKETLIP